MIDPLISMNIPNRRRAFAPGDPLCGEYQIDAVEAGEVQAIEASVLWYTEGKGEEDMAVHYFERRVRGDARDGDLRAFRRFTTTLPNSPLSYDGDIFKICWCMRIRIFLRHGKEYVHQLPFLLGDVPRAKVINGESDLSHHGADSNGS